MANSYFLAVEDEEAEEEPDYRNEDEGFMECVLCLNFFPVKQSECEEDKDRDWCFDQEQEGIVIPPSGLAGFTEEEEEIFVLFCKYEGSCESVVKGSWGDGNYCDDVHEFAFYICGYLWKLADGGAI